MFEKLFKPFQISCVDFQMLGSAPARDQAFNNLSVKNQLTVGKLFAGQIQTPSGSLVTLGELEDTTQVSLGDHLVGFRQSDSQGALENAVGSTVHQKLQEMVSVKDFGATGDGLTDDTVAFQNALSAGVSLYVPDGVYILTAPLTISNLALNLIGSGRQKALLKWTSTTGGISASTSAYLPQARYVIQNIGFITTRAAGGTALSLAVTRAYNPTVTINNVEFYGQNVDDTQYWSTCLQLTGVADTQLLNCYFSGGGNQCGQNIANCLGVVYNGTSNPLNTVHWMTNCHFDCFQTAVKVLPTGQPSIEGMMFTANVFNSCYNCVQIDASGATYTPPYFSFTSCQFQSTNSNLALTNVAQIYIAGCVFYGSTVSSSTPVVSMVGCLTAWFTNNFFVDFQTPVRTALSISNCNSVKINANDFAQFVTGISLASNATGVVITADNNFSTVTTPVSDTSGGTNKISVGSLSVNPSNGLVAITNALTSNPAIQFLSTGAGPDCAIQQISNGLTVTVGGFGNTKTGLQLNSAGRPAFPNMPESAVVGSLPSGSIYYNAGDSNRLYYKP